MFQDSAGTTPVTAVEQPVGLMLDKRLGLVEGAELVTNGTFDTNTTGWSAALNSTISAVSGRLRVTATSSPSLAQYSFATVVGRTYRIRATYTAGTATTPLFRAGSSPVGIEYFALTGANVLDTIERVFVATGTTAYVCGGSGAVSAGQYADFDNISVKELPGNHAFQATAASRPVLSARKNKLLATTTLATQSATLTASPHTLSFKGTGTVTLTGASTAGPLVGTGAGNRVSLTFTPTAGSVTFTVSGSVTEAQLEDGSAFTTYQRVTTATDYDTVGFPHYLKFDGVDDFLSTGNIDFTATDKMTVMAGVTITSTGVRIIYEHGANPEAGSGFGAKTGVVAVGDLTVIAYSTAITSRRTDASTLPIGQSTVLSHAIDIAGATAADEQQTRLNGITPTYAYSGGTGTGNLTSQIFYIGRRGGTSMPMGGRIHQLIVRGTATTPADILIGEKFVAGKTGVTLP